MPKHTALPSVTKRRTDLPSRKISPSSGRQLHQITPNQRGFTSAIDHPIIAQYFAWIKLKIGVSIAVYSSINALLRFFVL